MYDPSSDGLSSTITQAVAAMPSSLASVDAGTPDRVAINLLNAEHDFYSLNKDIWNDLALLYSGGPLLRRNAGRFLLMRPKEIREVYEARIAGLTYQNILSTGLGWYISKLFKTDPEIDEKVNGKALEEPNAQGQGGDPQWEYYDQFFRDADHNGTTFAAFGQEIFRHAIVYGRAYVLVDLPKTTQDAKSAAEQSIEPYLSILDPRTALNWQTDDYGNLEWIVFYTETKQSIFLKQPVTIKTWHFYDKREYRVYEKRSDEQQLSGEAGAPLARLIDRGPHAMSDFREDPDDPNSPVVGRVPIHQLILPEGLWLAGRVYLQVVDHLNTDNCLKWALFLQNLAMPVVKSDREFAQTFSETGFLQIGPNDAIEWVGPDGKTFELSAERLACLREEIFRSMYLQAQGRSSSASASTASGYSKEMDMAPSKDVLNSFGTILREALQTLLYLISKVRQDANMDFDVRGLSYDDDPQLNDIVAAVQVLDLVTGSPTFEREVKKTVARKFGESWNDDLKLKIAEELDAAPTQDELKAQQDELQTQTMEQQLNQAAGRLVTRAGSGRETSTD